MPQLRIHYLGSSYPSVYHLLGLYSMFSSTYLDLYSRDNLKQSFWFLNFSLPWSRQYQEVFPEPFNVASRMKTSKDTAWLSPQWPKPSPDAVPYSSEFSLGLKASPPTDFHDKLLCLMLRNEHMYPSSNLIPPVLYPAEIPEIWFIDGTHLWFHPIMWVLLIFKFNCSL